MRTAKASPFPYFKFYPRDWLEATRALTPEERGLYIDLIALTMKNEGSLDDDDAAIAHAMCVSKRLWRSVKARLEAKGKIILSDGKVVNERCVLELSALLDERKKRSSAATAREAGKRDFKPEISEKFNKINGYKITAVAQQENNSKPAKKFSSAASQPRVRAEPDANQIKLGSEISEKFNRINSHKTTDVAQSSHYTDSDLDNKKESFFDSKSARENMPPSHLIDRRWQNRDPHGLNRWQAESHDDVRIGDDGRIKVHNGFERDLRGILETTGIELDEALNIAVGYVPRAAAPDELKAKVLSQVTRLAVEAKERAAVRSARYPAQKPSPKPQASRGRPGR